MKDKPLYTVFARLIFKYEIAIGFEESTLDRDHNRYDFETNMPPDESRSYFAGDKEFKSTALEFDKHLITVDFKDARLEDVMNAVVRQMQNYRWQIDNDVVNIFPMRGRDPRFKKPLNLKIRSFGIDKGIAVGYIQPLLFRLPELKSPNFDHRVELCV